MGEDVIGFFEDFFEVGIGDVVGDEWVYYLEGQFVVGQVDLGGDFFEGEVWQVFWDVEVVVVGQVGEEDIFEVQGGCLVVGVDVMYV